MKKLIITAAAGLTFFASQASAIAGLVDVEVGGGTWGPTLTGDVAYGANATEMDLEKDLGIESDANSYMYMRFDHFIPIVPNLRVDIQNYTATGTGTATGDFNGVTFGTDTTTDITLNQTDIILYWGIPGVNALTAGILDIEFGIDVKQIEGEIALTSASASAEPADFSASIPLLYAAVLVDIPFIPVALEVSAKQLGSIVNETKAKIDFTLPLPIPLIDIGIEAGMKQQTIAITDDIVEDLEVTIDNSGVFFGANVKF